MCSFVFANLQSSTQNLDGDHGNYFFNDQYLNRLG